jgi:small GTP-binding protein
VTNKFPVFHIGTVCEIYNKNVLIDDVPYKLNIYDTAGIEDYDRLRPLSYKATDIFLICFSVISCWSFENITEKVSYNKLL